jgi:MFS family permease
MALALCGMFGVGFGISVTNVGINMLLQSAAPDALRGRIVSFFTATRFGFDALGGLLAGFLAALAGAGPTLIGEGVVLLGFVVFLMARRERLMARVTRQEEA